MIDIRFNTIFFLIFLTATHILAQDISTTNVKVVEGFQPSIPQATRLNEKAAFLDTLKKDRVQEYSVISPSLMSDYQTRPLKAAKVKPDRISQLYRNKFSFISSIYGFD